ncbi:conserved hypothetical protein [Ricinus communis]|uniref:Uncharacterized protein n=1 Tax=Ricinus communis TaxID=3988 RepID=B9RVC8_RICCO|nr:conserved hypothetical protein [Ricinus communis]
MVGGELDHTACDGAALHFSATTATSFCMISLEGRRRSATTSLFCFETCLDF